MPMSEKSEVLKELKVADNCYLVSMALCRGEGDHISGLFIFDKQGDYLNRDWYSGLVKYSTYLCPDIEVKSASIEEDILKIQLSTRVGHGKKECQRQTTFEYNLLTREIKFIQDYFILNEDQEFPPNIHEYGRNEKIGDYIGYITAHQLHDFHGMGVALRAGNKFHILYAKHISMHHGGMVLQKGAGRILEDGKVSLVGKIEAEMAFMKTGEKAIEFLFDPQTETFTFTEGEWIADKYFQALLSQKSVSK